MNKVLDENDNTVSYCVKNISKLQKKLKDLEADKRKVLLKNGTDADVKYINKQIKYIKRQLRELNDIKHLKFKDIIFCGGKIIYNENINRLQIIFNTRPDAHIVEVIKGCGFKWSTHYNLWQRFFNKRSIIATNWLKYKIKELYGDEVIRLTVNEYIGKFDEAFNTDLVKTINDNNYPMLDYAFRELGTELYATTDKTITLSRQKSAISEKLDATLNKEQKSLLEKYLDLNGSLSAETERQLMIFGFCMAFEQLKEMQALKI